MVFFLPITLILISGDFMAALVLSAGLAALMSTIDSQSLTLSSIFTRDILPIIKKGKSQNRISDLVFVVFLSIAGLLLAYNPPATILQIATQTFTGLAILFPTVIFGLYLKRVYSLPAILSILTGERLMLLLYFNYLTPGPFLPVVWVMCDTFLIYISTHLILSGWAGCLQLYFPKWMTNRYIYWMTGLFILRMDFWAWGRIKPSKSI